MLLARVAGTVVASRKEPKLDGLKFLLLEQIDVDGSPTGGYVVAIDAVGAGVGAGVPWDLWIGPLLAWLAFGLALYLVMVSIAVILRRRPSAVLGMGGFASGPGGVAAWLTRRPLVIHEQNAVAGMTNRLLARLARVVLQAFPGSFNSRIVAETVGNPVRDEIAAIQAPAERYADRAGPLRLLVQLRPVNYPGL